MFPLATILMVLIVVLTVVVYRRAFSQNEKTKFTTTIPGLKPSDPKSGNLADIAAAGSFHEFLVKMHNQYGPMVSFWFGQKLTVSVASPEILKDLKNVFDRPGELFQLFAPLIGDNSIQYANGHEGRLRRKTTDPCWSHDLLRHFCENFNELGEAMAANISSLPEKEHVPLCEYTMALTIKGLSQTSFGDYFKDDAKCHSLKHNYEICWSEMETRLDGYIPEPGSERDKKFNEGLHNLKNMVKDIVQRRKEHPPKPHEKAFIDVLIENSEMYPEPKLLDDACTYIIGGIHTSGNCLHNLKNMVKDIVKRRKEHPPKPHEKAFIDVLIENSEMYPEPKLLDDACSYMIGGFHTSGNLMAWTIYYMTQHSDIQEKVYQEVISIVGAKESISPEDISKFVYMKQVMNESLRVSILAPWAAKVQDVDVSLGGHVIQKGTPVVTALGVILQDEKIWKNPKKFDPDRFNPEKAKERHPQAFIPFGLPGRICPGYRFAYYELTVFMAILIRNFKFSLVEGQVVEGVYGLVTQPKEEIWVQVEKRQ